MTELNPDNKCAHLYKEYRLPKDSINDMLDTQLKLQKYYHSIGKAGNPMQWEKDYPKAVRNAVSHWNNVCVEYFELSERLPNGGSITLPKGDERLEILFEYIDMWHFVMNISIYLGITEYPKEIEIQYLYDHPPKGDLKISIRNVIIHWNALSYAWGRLCNLLPYKDWKTYPNLMKMSKEYLHQVHEELAVFIAVFVTMGIVLGVTPTEFYSLYMSKAKENIDRQKRGY